MLLAKASGGKRRQTFITFDDLGLSRVSFHTYSGSGCQNFAFGSRGFPSKHRRGTSPEATETPPKGVQSLQRSYKWACLSSATTQPQTPQLPHLFFPSAVEESSPPSTPDTVVASPPGTSPCSPSPVSDDSRRDIFQVISEGPTTGPFSRLVNSQKDIDGDGSHAKFVLEALLALNPTFRIVSGSYSTTLINAASAAKPDLDLDLAVRAFGPFGSRHTVFQDGVDYGMLEMDATKPRAKKSNFVVVKAAYGSCNLSVKIYKHGYLQIFGLSDRPNLSATAAGNVIARFVLELLNASGVPVSPVVGFTPLEPISLLASNQGLTDIGLALDLDWVESLWRAAAESSRDRVSISRHVKNKSVIVSQLSPSGEKLGSQIFFSTGTIQIMGVRDAGPFASRLRALVTNYPICVMVPTKKKRIRIPQPTARVQRLRLQQDMIPVEAPPRRVPTAPTPLSLHDHVLAAEVCQLLGGAASDSLFLLTDPSLDAPLVFNVDMSSLDLLLNSDLWSSL